MTVALVALPKGTPVSSPLDFFSTSWGGDGNVIQVKSYINTHGVIFYPSIPKDYDPSTETGTAQRVIESHQSSDTGKTYATFTDIVYLQKNADEFDLYSLEKLLNGGYNVVTLCPGENESMPKAVDDTVTAEQVGQGDAYIGCHQMGSVLVRGDATFGSNGKGLADSPNADNPSYVGGYFGDTPGEKKCFINSRTNNDDHVNFYLGSSNEIVGNYVNGIRYAQELGGTQHGINYCGDTIVNDNFVDWNRLVRVVRDTSEALADAATTTIDATAGQMVNVPMGSNVVIDCADGAVFTVNVVGEGADSATAPGTVINFLNKGDMTVPVLHINGNQLNTVETGEGFSVLFNYPNCTGTVSGPGTSEFGHVVAPKALIKITGGNYSGTMVGNNVYLAGNAEGHLYPYRGDTLLGFYGDMDFDKRVNNDEPSANQKYSFVLEQLNDVVYCDEGGTPTTTDDWRELQTVKNVGRSIPFKDVHFTKSGDFYFRVYEKQSTQTGVTTDTTQYLVEVPVRAHADGSNTQLYIDTDAGVKFYKIIDAENLVQEDRVQEAGKNDKIVRTINTNAIEPAGSLNWTKKQDSEDGTISANGDSNVRFYNTVADASVTLNGTKTLEGRDLKANEFAFSVKDVTGPNLVGVDGEGNEVTTRLTNATNNTIVATGKNAASGAIAFTSINYHSSIFDGIPGEIHKLKFTYKVTEDMPEGATEENSYTVDGVTYDPHEYEVTVIVTEGDGGSMSAQITEGGDPITFTNSEEAQKGSLKITKNVTVNGEQPTNGNKAAADGTFTYSVKGPGVDGAEQMVTVEVVNGAAVTKTVSDLDPGIYTVTELTDGDHMPAGWKLVQSVQNPQTVEVVAGENAEVPRPFAVICAMSGR